MGKGIAKDFKRIYPEMFREYQRLCEKRLLTVGKLWLYKTPHKWVLNFPTKTTWKLPSRVEYIDSGLKTFLQNYAMLGITSIAFPPPGCGNGELDWDTQVRPLMVKYLSKVPIDVFIYLAGKQFAEVPEHKNIEAMRVWLRSEPAALGFVEVWQDLSKIIGTGLILQTLTDRESFRVEIAAGPEPGIALQVKTQQHFVPQDELSDLWSLIRDYGFCMEKIMPPSLGAFTDQIVALFSRLSYCKAVELSTDSSDIGGSRTIGIQLMPTPMSPSLMHRLPYEVTPIG
jgi:hypothetical protein